MPQLGSEQNPVRFNPNKRIKVGGRYMQNEDTQKYKDNYDRIFNKSKNTTNHKELVE
tara:strand:- start:150 stop:320 length:171 start_codon:yes stop_codon:yes gene_type:complete